VLGIGLADALKSADRRICQFRDPPALVCLVDLVAGVAHSCSASLISKRADRLRQPLIAPRCVVGKRRCWLAQAP
jgi:hypothetical protein